jgi:hypothetical protein
MSDWLLNKELMESVLPILEFQLEILVEMFNSLSSVIASRN